MIDTKDLVWLVKKNLHEEYEIQKEYKKEIIARVEMIRKCHKCQGKGEIEFVFGEAPAFDDEWGEADIKTSWQICPKCNGTGKIGASK